MDFSDDPEVTIQDAIKRLSFENRVETGDQIVTVTNILADGKVVESIQLRRWMQFSFPVINKPYKNHHQNRQQVRYSCCNFW